MKHKYLAILMGIIVSVSVSAPTSIYAAETAIENEAEDISEENREEILGEVKSVGEENITILTGTRKEMGQGEISGNTEGEKPSMLDLTGEEMIIMVTEDTVITRENMQKPEGSQPGGEVPEKPESEENGEIPEKPEGEENSGASEKPEGEENGEPPEKPEGEEGGEDPQRPDGGQSGEIPENQSGGSISEEIELSDIQEGDTVAVTLDEDGSALTITVQSMRMGGTSGMGGPGGQAQEVTSYDATNEYTEDEIVENASLDSTGTDENAALISNGASVTLDQTTITRKSSDSTGGDSSSFYGVGAAVLATDGEAYVKDSAVTTDSAGGAGIFAYGEGTVYTADTVITTQQDTSGGIHAAGGGTLYAWDLNVETNGESSAAIRSDRGGGTMVIDGGSYVSNGVGSPAVYCTADIAVNNAELTANGSEAVCIEGLNSLRLYNSNLTGNMDDDEQNDTTWTVILYQSMSGDSEIGNSTFQMDGGSITSQNGGLFYTTNTECTIALNDVNITYSDDSEFFLQCTGNNNQRGWGKTGANGSDCHFTASNQNMQGDIIWDSISDLDFYMTEGSTLEGAFVNDEAYAGNGGDGYCNVYVSADSTWKVTGDSRVSSLSNEGAIEDENGNSVTIQGTDGTVYEQGDSEYTITVDAYQNTADLSESAGIEAWSSYAVERPEGL